jgi:hypothetical protein
VTRKQGQLGLGPSVGTSKFRVSVVFATSTDAIRGSKIFVYVASRRIVRTGSRPSSSFARCLFASWRSGFLGRPWCNTFSMLYSHMFLERIRSSKRLVAF